MLPAQLIYVFVVNRRRHLEGVYHLDFEVTDFYQQGGAVLTEVAGFGDIVIEKLKGPGSNYFPAQPQRQQ
jgi:hypothetical protein